MHLRTIPPPAQYFVETKWGTCRIAWTERGLARVSLPAHDLASAPAGSLESDGAAPAEVAACAGMLRAYFGGEVVDFRSVRLDQGGLSPIEQAIYACLREIGYGRTTTYGDLAVSVGHHRAAREVGVAMARNRWPIVVPCHRVLAKGGSLGGFSAPGGVKTKRRLLALEGAGLDWTTPPLPGLFG